MKKNRHIIPSIFLYFINAGNATSEANSNHPTIRDAIMKIRFLTLTPQQFAEGPGKSSLLSESEKFAILMNICSPSAAVSMPEGFSPSTTPRRKKHPSEPFCVVSKTILRREIYIYLFIFITAYG